MSASSVAGVICPSRPSRQSTTISSPASTVSAGGRSGCQRLWPVSGASISERRIGGFSSCRVIEHLRDRGRRGPAALSLGLAELPRRLQVVDREQREQARRRGSSRSRSARACRRSARASRGSSRRPGRPQRHPPARPGRPARRGCAARAARVRSVGSSRDAAGSRRERLVGDREDRARARRCARSRAVRRAPSAAPRSAARWRRCSRSAPPVVIATAE